ncbi:MAG: hypothetical protein KDC34_03370 [Saprospiraceae bacterium]|nr:hypothetical protein [Saprospiraceae bacterium]
MTNTATFTLAQLQKAFDSTISSDNLLGVREVVRRRLNANTNYHFEFYDITVKFKKDLFQISAPHLTSQEILDAINQ